MLKCVWSFSFFFFTTVLSQWYFPWDIRIAFPGESKLRQSRAAQPTLPAGCFSVSIIHRTLTWTTGSLTCAQMLMRAIAHRDIRTHVRESAQKVDSGRKSLATPGNQTCVSGVPFRCSTNELHPLPQNSALSDKMIRTSLILVDYCSLRHFCFMCFVCVYLRWGWGWG